MFDGILSVWVENEEIISHSNGVLHLLQYGKIAAGGKTMQIHLKEIRQKKGLTHEELSKLSGVTRSYIIEMEEGKYKNPGAEILCKLAKALECKLDDLIKCED